MKTDNRWFGFDSSKRIKHETLAKQPKVCPAHADRSHARCGAELTRLELPHAGLTRLRCPHGHTTAKGEGTPWVIETEHHDKVCDCLQRVREVRQ